MLSKGDIERISSLWLPSKWPEFGDNPYALAGHKIPFSWYLARIGHLGLFGDTLIDAGCGTGRWAFAFATRFNRVVGIDKTADRIATALWLRDRFETPEIEFMAGDVRHLPSDDNSVDTVYSNSVVMGGISLNEVFLEAFRVLKTGGVFYIGLNGTGYGRHLMEHPDPAIAALGRQRVYATYRQIGFASLPAELYPSGRLNEMARSQLDAATGPSDFLAAIGCSAAQLEAADTIAAELGSEFTRQLMNELAAITAGRRPAFSPATAGRDYEPQEIVETARAVGFDRVEWAPDGFLSLGPDGSITKAPCPQAKASLPEFKGRLRVFEALLWKPGAA